MIKTSQIDAVLKTGGWSVFCSQHRKEKDRLLSRVDWTAISSDLKMSFDKADSRVSSSQVKNICLEILENKISVSDGFFVFTLLALAGFEFDTEATEEAVFSLSSPDSYESLDAVTKALQSL